MSLAPSRKAIVLTLFQRDGKSVSQSYWGITPSYQAHDGEVVGVEMSIEFLLAPYNDQTSKGLLCLMDYLEAVQFVFFLHQ